MSERLLTTRQVAEFLGVSPETVLRRWRSGELPGYRLASNVLRFRESEILNLRNWRSREWDTAAEAAGLAACKCGHLIGAHDHTCAARACRCEKFERSILFPRPLRAAAHVRQ